MYEEQINDSSQKQSSSFRGYCNFVKSVIDPSRIHNNVLRWLLWPPVDLYYAPPLAAKVATCPVCTFRHQSGSHHLNGQSATPRSLTKVALEACTVL